MSRPKILMRVLNNQVFYVKNVRGVKAGVIIGTIMVTAVGVVIDAFIRSVHYY